MTMPQVLTTPDVTDDQILEQLRAVLSANFEIEPQTITPQADLFSDLVRRLTRRESWRAHRSRA